MNPYDARRGRDSIRVGSVLYRRGDRVRLKPRGNADAFDLVLRGMTAIIESVEVDQEDRVYLSVTIEDDPGRDLGIAGKPAHRFFYGPDEVEWLGPAAAAERTPLPSSRRLLIAGIGNLFFGDDGFGVEVVRRLMARPLPEGVRVIDFGIRGFDLACALTGEYGGAILVDAMSRGEAPGTLFVIVPEATTTEAPAAVETHGLHPARVLQFAGALGEVCPWLRLVGCEPLTFGSEQDPAMGLSAPVAAAVDEAVGLVESLVRNYLDGLRHERETEGV